jgi:alkylated DNA repair protein alkB family protein 8
MARVLRRSGKALIYVWAKNQKKNNKKSSYLRQGESNPNKEEILNQEVTIENENQKISLPVHTNRTEFQHQDLFVPWKLKDAENKQVFLRYYHVYEELELERDCEEVEGVKVIKSYYDQGNWCVIIEKS